MAQVKVDATGEVFEAPDDQIGVLAARGGFSFPAGTQVPLRQPDGSVTAVPVEQYWANPTQYTPALPQDIVAHQAALAGQQAEAQEAALDEQYGQGITNLARAHGEAALRGASLGLSDALLTTMGADPTGLKERAERNAFTGASEFAGAVVPALLTGGESAVAGGVAKGIARATPTALAEGIGERVGAKVAASLGEGFSSRMAAGTARLATEGALAGVGGEISARAMDDRALLDSGTMDEYLMAAGQGALIGGAMGAAGTAAAAGVGKLAQLGQVGYGKVKGALGGALDAYGAPVREAESALAAATSEGDSILAGARAADYDADVRAATQRMDALTPEDVGGEISKAKSLREQARAKLAAQAPTAELLPGAGGMPAHAPLDAIGARVKQEAKALGVEPKVADDAWARIEQGKQVFEAQEATHATRTKKIAGIIDEMEEHRQDIDDTIGMARRNDSVREAIATDRTVAPAEQFQNAMQMQHMRTRSVVKSFFNDDELKVKSYAKKLDAYLEGQEADLAKLDMRDPTQRADALEILDQSNRVVGRYRDMAGEQVGVTGAKSFPDMLSGLYEESRQLLKNPEIVGQRAAEVIGKQKGNWSNVLDVSRGYKQALLRFEAGGKRSISGFESAPRGDTSKIAPLLNGIDDPAAQLNLELIGRGIDSRAQLMQGYLDDLGLTGKAADQVKRYRALSQELADEIVKHRSEQQLAKEFVSLAAPGLKEIEGLDVKIAGAEQKAQERFATQRAKLQATVDAARAKADELRAAGNEKAAVAKGRLVERAQAKLDAAKDKASEGFAGTAVEAAAPLIGAIVGGPMGFVAGQAAGNMIKSMALPVMRSVARNALGGMLKAQEKATQFAAVHAIGSRISKAAAGVVDRLHKAGPYRAASRTIAMRAPRDTQEEFDRTMAWVDKAGPYDARAAYLKGIAPVSVKPAQLRPDLDAIPTVHPLAQRKFLRAARAVQDPAGVFEDLAQGVQSKEAGDAVRALYPRLHERAAMQITEGAATMDKKPTMRAQQELSLFFGQPIHFTMKPEFVAAVQSTYETANAAGQGSQDMLQEQGGKSARQYNSKTPQMMATQTQRLEAGIT